MTADNDTWASAIDTLKAVRKAKLYEQIVAQIQKLIDEGRLKHGDQLPPERELAEIFQVSRHSVREAIRILEQKHVLKSRPGSGTFVIIEDEPSVVEYLARAIHKEKDKLAEIFQFRQILEPQIARLAAENAENGDLKTLEEIYQHQQQNVNDVEQSSKDDLAFHTTLARATHNSILLHVVELVNTIINESRAEALESQSRRSFSLEGHARIIDAIRQRNPQRAMQAMSEHIALIEEIVVFQKEES